MDGATLPGGHGALMDSIYRRQRHIYDLTRKYYLFGRDTAIREMACAPGMRVLEVGCGTGRNLAQIGKCWPGVERHGLDISSAMLESARARLGAEARLALGDATDFDAERLFGHGEFDRILISFAASMIPRWREAIAHAAGHLAPGGSLHVVDFGSFGGMPPLLRKGMLGWLRRFHVTPRNDMVTTMWGIARTQGLEPSVRRGPLGYYRIVVLRRPG